LTVPTADRRLSVSGLSARAGSFALGPVSLDVPADRVLVVLGPSGAGKTMLLETIAGLRPQRAGQISLAGTDIASLPPERRRIGLVFQDAALFPHLTVRDNIRFGPRARRAMSPDGSGDLLRQLGIEHLADRDEALSLGDDLAVIVGGQLRQTGPAATVASQPADPDIARLLGWSELGHGTADSGTARIGQLVLRDTAEGPHGPVQAFYRPEDVELRPATPDEPADGSLTAPVERIVHTRPLARITLGCDPPIAALVLHRDIGRLQLTPGNPVQVSMPPGSLRIFPGRTEP
jgi:ABC-type Fe3+/spermidine/putrescine transport system ATPase subunit